MPPVHLLLLVLALVVFYSLGAFFRIYLNKKGIEKKNGIGAVESSMLALFAFFLGFAFSISASKMEKVREATIEESNAIGTALLRTQLYPDSTQTQLKGLFKGYIKSRIDYFENAKDEESDLQYLNTTLQKGQSIWDKGVALQKTKTFNEESRLFLPAVNDMIDAVSSRDSAINAQLPPIIVNTLFILCFCASFIIGYGMKKKLPTNFIGILYILAIALTVNLIMDASNPRDGFINTKKANSTIMDIYKEL